MRRIRHIEINPPPPIHNIPEPRIRVFVNLDFDLIADLTVENINTSFAGGVVAHTNPAPGHRLSRGA